MSEPTYKLIINPEWEDRSNLRETYEGEIQRYEHIVDAIGKARGWGEHPRRWDLVTEAGLDALLKEQK